MPPTVEIDGRQLELENLDKPFFPNAGLTKADLISYYRRIALTALPHYRDRPLTMQRFPDGIAGQGFFQKHRPGHYPAWIDSVRLEKADGYVDHVLVNDEATLTYIVNQGCITLHLALSRRDQPHHPDRLVFDLDPSDEDFGKVQSAALMLKELLDALELTSFVQTTGSRGLHVVVPLDRQLPFDRTRQFARRAAEVLVRRDPERLTIEQRKKNRGRAVFIDYLRNGYAQTAVAPYSVRAREGAPVATPLRWEEVGAESLSPRSYTLANIFRRLGQIDDPWADIAGFSQSLTRAEATLDEQA